MCAGHRGNESGHEIYTNSLEQFHPRTAVHLRSAWVSRGSWPSWPEPPRCGGGRSPRPAPSFPLGPFYKNLHRQLRSCDPAVLLPGPTAPSVPSAAPPPGPYSVGRSRAPTQLSLLLPCLELGRGRLCFLSPGRRSEGEKQFPSTQSRTGFHLPVPTLCSRAQKRRIRKFV